MSARERLVRAASELRPFKQGGLDGLCGLYSIVNAITLALHPRLLTKRQAIELFNTGIRSLAERDLLTAAMVDGITADEWNELINALVAEASRMANAKLVARRPLAGAERLTAPMIRSAVRDALDQGWPTLLSLDQAYDHFTVAAGYSDSRVTLFDSGAAHWVAWRSLTALGRRHRVERQGLVIVFESEGGSEGNCYGGR